MPGSTLPLGADLWEGADVSLWTAFWYPPINEYTVQSPMAHNAYVWGSLAARPPLDAPPGR